MLNTNRNLLFKAIILALCTISFVHVFLFPLYELKNRRGAARTFSDLEQSLCMSNIKKRGVWRSGRCPQYGVVSVVQGGRLGNQMWEYASVWALARRTGLEPYVPRCIRTKLDQVFEHLTVSTFEEIGHCPMQMEHFVRSLDAWNFTNQSIILPRYYVQPELVLTWVQDIVQEFTMRKKLVARSQEVLQAVVKATEKEYPKNITPTFVGVHVRRTDYIGYLRIKHHVGPAHRRFFLAAMKIFEEKYEGVVFVVVSDDPVWCWKTFLAKNNAYVVGWHQKNSPALDMAILAACNHTIYDYGTFGEWGAILAGGDTIYYNVSSHSSAKLGQLMANWHTI
ncbi:unnamed protein product [Phaedon cochleariae]|uniref:L-Fucosyltransferase n=1 Tax=Phaedon cochleariae TaxID=80249 RepID=A0A9P0DME1_PHACE|nr:unnamed protein product [Phaedon cochleariae]